MKKLLKTLELIGALSGLFFLQSVNYCRAAGVYYDKPIEAENGTIIAPMSKDIDEKASQVYFIEIPRNTTGVNGTAQYSFAAPAGLRVMLWLRVKLADAASNSFFISLDNTANYVFDGWPLEEWIWQKAGAYTLFTNTTTHLLKIRQREKGAKLDKIVITNSTGIPDCVLKSPPILQLGMPPAADLLSDPGFERPWYDYAWQKIRERLDQIIPLWSPTVKSGNFAVQTTFPSYCSAGSALGQIVNIPQSGTYRFCAWGMNAAGASKGYLMMGGVRQDAIPNPPTSSEWQEYCTPPAYFSGGSNVAVELGTDCRTCYFNWDDARMESLSGTVALNKSRWLGGDAQLYETDNFDFSSTITDSIKYTNTYFSDANKYIGIYFYLPGAGAENQNKWAVGPGYYRIKVKNDSTGAVLRDFIVNTANLEGLPVRLPNVGNFSIGFYRYSGNLAAEIDWSRHPYFGHLEEWAERGLYYPDSLNLISDAKGTTVLQPYINRCNTQPENELRLSIRLNQGLTFPLAKVKRSSPPASSTQTASSSTANSASFESDPGYCTFLHNKALLERAFHEIENVNPIIWVNDPRDPTGNTKVSIMDYTTYYMFVHLAYTNSEEIKRLYREAADCSWGTFGEILVAYADVKAFEKLAGVTSNPGYALNTDKPGAIQNHCLAPGSNLYGVYGLKNGISPCQTASDVISNRGCNPYYLVPGLSWNNDCPLSIINDYIKELKREAKNNLAYAVCNAVRSGYLEGSIYNGDFACPDSAKITGLKTRAESLYLSFTPTELGIYQGEALENLREQMLVYYYMKKGAFFKSFGYYGFKDFNPIIDGIGVRNDGSVLQGRACLGLSQITRQFFHGSHNSARPGNTLSCGQMLAEIKSAINTDMFHSLKFLDDGFTAQEMGNINIRPYGRFKVSQGFKDLAEKFVAQCPQFLGGLQELILLQQEMQSPYPDNRFRFRDRPLPLTEAQKIGNRYVRLELLKRLVLGETVVIGIRNTFPVWSRYYLSHALLVYNAGGDGNTFLVYDSNNMDNFGGQLGYALPSCIKYVPEGRYFEYLNGWYWASGLEKMQVPYFVTIEPEYQTYILRHQEKCPCVNSSPGTNSGVNQNPPLCNSCEKLGQRPEPVSWDGSTPACGNGRHIY